LAEARKEVSEMSWKTMSQNEKIRWLEENLAEIERTRALLERFERVTRKWIKNVKTPVSKK
jgi:hypothetical protein